MLRVWPRLQIGWAVVFSLFGPRTWATLLMGWCRPAFSPRMQDHNWAEEDLFGPVLKLKMFSIPVLLILRIFHPVL